MTCAYDDREALTGITLDIPARRVTALIGPSGCGKSTLLRVLSRMGALHVRGSVRLDGEEIYGASVDPVALRRKVGFIAREPWLFPGTVFENVAFGLDAAGVREPLERRSRVEAALRRAALWDELADALHRPAAALPRGLWQQLCVARALALDPVALLLDEPTGGLDAVATARMEALLAALRDSLTVVVVTHGPQQAARVSQCTAFFLDGALVEVGDTRVIFTRPRREETRDYVTGRFG